MNNVIYIVCDQLRANALSCYFDNNINTPNIDLLANEGVKFENAIATNPLCCPARGNMLTGLHNSNHSVIGHEDKLVDPQANITDAFNKAGYETMYVGKWHLDGFKEANGLAREHVVKREDRFNFKTWIGYENNNSPFDNVYHGHKDGVEIDKIRTNQYEVDFLTDLSIDLIEEKKEDNFFMWLNFQPPHNPYVAPAKYLDKFKYADIKLLPNVPTTGAYPHKARMTLPGYYAMIKNIDDNIGKLVSYLRSNGLYEKTHIVFTSDHGDMHQSHGCELKTNYFEESIKVPFIIGGTTPFYYKYRCGSTTRVIGQSDVAPTLCGLAGITHNEQFEGEDLSGARLDYGFKEKENYKMFGLMRRSLSAPSDRQFRGIYTSTNWKYVYAEEGPVALYDLNEDKYEQANLLFNPNYSSIKEKLHSLLIDELNKQNDNFLNFIK